MYETAVASSNYLNMLSSTIQRNFVMPFLKFDSVFVGLFEAFLESAPQFITQLYIIFTAGNEPSEFIQLNFYLGFFKFTNSSSGNANK